jgi:hypothetical protein
MQKRFYGVTVTVTLTVCISAAAPTFPDELTVMV